MSEPRGAAAPAKPRTIAMMDIMEAMADLAGFCLACGDQHDGCDPDARALRCQSCGKPEVYGAEEIVLMGRVHT